MPPIPIEPKVGDTLYCVIGSEAVQVRATSVDDVWVKWESVLGSHTGKLNYNGWCQAAAVQKVMLAAIRDDLSVEMPSDERMIAALKKISGLCGQVGRMEAIQDHFATNVIRAAAGDMRRIQQIVFDTLNYVAPEKPT